MTVSLPQTNFSWMGQLANAFGPQHQQQQMGNSYFPPAPSAATAAAPMQTPVAGGSFLQRLIGQMPANQAAGNQYQPNMRIGG